MDSLTLIGGFSQKSFSHVGSRQTEKYQGNMGFKILVKQYGLEKKFRVYNSG